MGSSFTFSEVANGTTLASLGWTDLAGAGEEGLTIPSTGTVAGGRVQPMESWGSTIDTDWRGEVSIRFSRVIGQVFRLILWQDADNYLVVSVEDGPVGCRLLTYVKSPQTPWAAVAMADDVSGEYLNVVFGPRCIRASIGDQVERSRGTLIACVPPVDVRKIGAASTAAVYSGSLKEPGESYNGCGGVSIATDAGVTQGIGGTLPRVPDDDSVVATCLYTAIDTKRLPGVNVLLTGAGLLSDSIFSRLDHQQTLITVPAVLNWTVSLAAGMPRLTGWARGGLVVSAGHDPAGPDRGMGSGRATMDVGGEIVFDLGGFYQGTTIGFSVQQYTSDSGPPHLFASASNRIARMWDAEIGFRISRLRHVERLVGIHGGGRVIWCIPTLDDRPAMCIMSSLRTRMTSSVSARLETNLLEVAE